MSTAEVEAKGETPASQGLRLIEGLPKEALPSREEYMGELQIIVEPFSTGDLNVFSQQRAGENEEQSALKDSLRGGQVNPVNVVIVDYGRALEYLEFTNKTWRGDMKAEQLRPLPARYKGDPYAGKYAILVAGHSRVKGLRALAKEGYEDDLTEAEIRADAVKVKAQIHPIDSIEGILRIQLAENVHHAPSKDRAFRAIAEMYLFMEERDARHKIPKKAFAQHFGISEQTLRDALNYALLPEEVRQHTDDGVLPMGILVALARARTAIVNAHTHTARHDPRYAIPDALDGEERAERQKIFDQAVDAMTTETIRMLIARYNNLKKRTVVAGKALIGSHATHLRRRYEPPKVGSVILDMEGLFESAITVEEQLRLDREEIVANLREFYGRDMTQGRELARRLARTAIASGDDGTYLREIRNSLAETLDSAQTPAAA